MSTISVDLPGQEHTIVVAPGVLGQIGDQLPDAQPGAKAILVTSPYLDATYGDQVRHGLTDFELHTVTVDDGEANKRVSTLAAIWEGLAKVAAGRNDLVIALGGGVIGDMAGFAAATFNRGMGVVQVPTTVLAMVDSAIGGKTGINLQAGKNLVGAFHQPLAIVMDPTVLATLDGRQRMAGLGEAAKYAFIADPTIAEHLERYAHVLAGDGPVPVEIYSQIVQRSAQIKVDHIVQDPFEHGVRAHLNYGHTIGHAIEHLCGYGVWLHGEAVGLGMIAAARLGFLLGMVDASLEERTRDLLAALGLPIRLGRDLTKVTDPAALWAVIGRDKKNRPGQTRFVLPIEMGQVQVVANPEPSLVLEALEAIA